MITIFNRRELITLASMQKLTCVREALSTAGIVPPLKSGELPVWQAVPGMASAEDRRTAFTPTRFTSIGTIMTGRRL